MFFLIWSKCLKQDDSVNHSQTCFCYSIFKMPICRESKENLRIGRMLAYFEECVKSDEKHLGHNEWVRSR